jgi:hypothetical protein
MSRSRRDRCYFCNWEKEDLDFVRRMDCHGAFVDRLICLPCQQNVWERVEELHPGFLTEEREPESDTIRGEI